MSTNSKAYGKQWYEDNKEKRIKQIKANKTRLQNLIKDYKRTLSCERCGYNQHPGALDFHHKDPSKKSFSIGDAANRGFSWDKTKLEIDKCEVICANCHRIEHIDY